MTTRDDQLFNERMEAYATFSGLPQALAGILAIIPGTTARTNLLNILKRILPNDGTVKQFKAGDLDPLLDRLVKNGLIAGKDNYYHCLAPFKDPICRLLVKQGLFVRMAVAVEQFFQVKLPVNRWDHLGYDQIIYAMRMAIYRGETDNILNLLHLYEEHRSRDLHLEDHPLVAIFRHGFDSRWARDFLSEELQICLAGALAVYFRRRGVKPAPEFIEFLNAVASSSKMETGEYIRGYLAERLVLDGCPEEAGQMVAGDNGMYSFLVRGDAAFLRGENDKAITAYETALRLLRKKSRKRKIYFNSVSGLLFILALIKSDDARHLKAARTYAAIGAENPEQTWYRAFSALGYLITARSGDPDALEVIRQWRLLIVEEEAISCLIQLLVRHWMGKSKNKIFRDLLLNLHEHSVDGNMPAWLVAELSTLMVSLKIKTPRPVQAPAGFFEKSGYQSIVDLLQPETRWQQALKALINLDRAEDASTGSTRFSRMAWLLDFDDDGYWELSPREQIKKAGGKWSKGRKIALRRLCYELDKFDFITPHDEKICAAIKEERHTNWHGYPEIDYYFSDKALTALAGHPAVFSADPPHVPLEIVKESPALMVKRIKGGKFEIILDHEFDVENPIQLIQDSPTRLKVIETGKDVLQIAKIVGDGLTIPAAGKKQLLEAVSKISSTVNVHSQIDGVGETAEAVDADATPAVFLRPSGDGLKLSVWIQPFAQDGPCFRPGEGGETVICEIGGKLSRTRRDFDRECELAEAAVSACPTLASFTGSGGERWEWDLSDPESCLEILLELKALDSQVVLHWPEGESLAVSQQADISRLFLNVSKSRDWFSVSGDLKLDNGLVLSMEKLIDLLDSARGRFVRLEDGQFLALTKAFQRRLEALSAYSKKSGKDRQFHPLAALCLDEMAGEVGGLKSDRHWKNHIKQFRAACAFKPEVPSTLKAELRDYQVEGFAWLARLCHWGVGACLADDMGLGKTIQTLALMLTRAANGPCLVVAPTSVCMNWEAEARRFAPSLNPVGLGNGDREKIVSCLKPFDLLVVSYGLLQQEAVAEMLAGVHFEIIVLDEAQAIKNMTTKRSRAAMNLDGKFRLITTGTPIENHLGELWNLFRFINPGLLGSLKGFTGTFAVPIEKDQDRAARRRLRKLIQPFILRRTKSHVLEELPPRTDILVPVELSAKERAFYEALRIKALEALSGGDVSEPGAHLRILAEIMKLRRVCCHPQLVLPDSNLPSAKLSAFGDIVTELLSGGHKALVFSQFTGHLKIIRDYVESQSIPYQYLDGSTPEKERRRRVAAFQDGDGELFLISLKAGGVGLNLTAADYVIHMDPWWNPAVEDQAADRAHRIGQTRPVTVYSLIAGQTIEEKIVSLHRSKRDLADSLLEGSDLSGKMSAEELLRLIKG